MAKKKALGKGLGALLESAESGTDISKNYAIPDKKSSGGTSTSKIKISDIRANPYNPRTKFEKEALEELAESIKVHGIIQPITVRKAGGGYQIISGERRFRASQLAGLEEIPVYVREADDETVLEMALVENIQREDLDAIEIAISFQRLMEECNLTQEGLSQKLGKNRSTITNYLRLIKLPADVQIAIRDKKISMGHARAIAGIEKESDQLDVLKKVLQNGLSVRQTEKLSASVGEEKPKKSNKQEDAALSFEQQKVKDDLEDYLGTRISIKKGNNGVGKIVINFASESDFKRIIDLLDF